MQAPDLNKYSKSYALYLALFGYLCIALFTVFYFNGTGDSGDSVLHYLFARYAPDHPELFFNHWAKPVYVLLASPFAQFGFIGIKLFNVLVTLITLYFTFKITQKAGIRNGLFHFAFFLFAPVSFALTFSGLTEPLFALFISVGIYLILQNRWMAAAIVISFLPFVRSEGLIICAIFGLYFILKNNWKILPFLLAGHVVYSVAGYFVHKDIFWVFSKIPYAHLSSTYGNGQLFHFVDQLNYVIGIPIYFLLSIGLIAFIWKVLKKQFNLEIHILVYLAFLAFFVAHSLFWYLGIFNSMGLKRVFVGVMPLISIIALIGFNFLAEELIKRRTVQKIVQIAILLVVFVFPFTPNHAALNVDKDLRLSKDQLAMEEVASFVKRKLGMKHRLIFAPPYLSHVLEIDHFDPKIHLELDSEILKYCGSGDVIIWDSWFAVQGNGITKEIMDNQPEMTCLYTKTILDGNREVTYAVYQKD